MTKTGAVAIKRYGSEGIKRCALDIKKKNVMKNQQKWKDKESHEEEHKISDVTIPIHMLVRIGY